MAIIVRNSHFKLFPFQQMELKHLRMIFNKHVFTILDQLNKSVKVHAMFPNNCIIHNTWFITECALNWNQSITGQTNSLRWTVSINSNIPLSSWNRAMIVRESAKTRCIRTRFKHKFSQTIVYRRIGTTNTRIYALDPLNISQ